MPSFFVARDRFGGRVFDQCNCVADFNVLDALYARDDVTNITCGELIFGDQLQLVLAKFVDIVVTAAVHEVDCIFGFERALHDADLQNHTAVFVKVSIKHERFERSVGIAGWWRKFGDDAFEHVFDV